MWRGPPSFLTQLGTGLPWCLPGQLLHMVTCNARVPPILGFGLSAAHTVRQKEHHCHQLDAGRMKHHTEQKGCCVSTGERALWLDSLPYSFNFFRISLPFNFSSLLFTFPTQIH